MTQTKAELLQTRHQGDIRLGDADSTHYVGFKAPATVSSSLVWTLPAADGTANYLLKTDGSGNLGWVADSSTDSTKMPLAGGIFTGNVTSNDNVEARFGTGGDFRIYHDGTDNYLQTGAVTTHFRVDNGNRLSLKSDGNVQMQGSSGKNFEWKTTGILSLADNAKATFGTGDDLEIYHDGSHSFIYNTGTGYLIVADDGHIFNRTNDFRVQSAGGSENIIIGVKDSSVDLYFDGVKQINTTSTGVTLGDSKRIDFGDGADLRIYHDGSTNIIDASTSNAISFRRGGSEQFFIGNAEFKGGDNKKIKLGTGDDLQIYHDGTDNRIDAANGHIYLRVSSTENAIKCTKDGNVEISYDGTKKLETSANGVNLFGSLVFDNPTNAGKDINWLPQYNFLRFEDNVKAVFGNAGAGAADLQIYHDGSNSRIKNSTGSLWLQSDTGIRFTDEDVNESMAAFYDNGAVELFYDGSKKFETTADGCKIPNVDFQFEGTNASRTIYFDASINGFRWNDNAVAYFGNGQDLQIFHNGTNSVISDSGTGNLSLQTNDSNVNIWNSSGSEYLAVFKSNNANELYYDGSKKLATSASGVEIENGDLRVHLDLKIITDNRRLWLGAGNDLSIFHNGTNSEIDNNTGTLYLESDGTWITDKQGSDKMAKFLHDGAVELYYDNSKKLETQASGIDVTGTVGCDKIVIDGPYQQIAEAMGALDVNCGNGNYFTKTISGNSTFTFSNVPSSGTSFAFTLELTHSSGTVTWPSSVKWNADTAPTLTTGKTHLFMFVTDDGGSRWRGSALVDYVN